MEELRLLQEAREQEEHKLAVLAQMSEERQAELDANYRQQVEDMLGQVEAEKQEASELARQADADPTTWLSESELRQAQTRQAFLREELESGELDTDKLITRMRLALSDDDRAAAWLLWKYAPGLEGISEQASIAARAEYQDVRSKLENYVIPQNVRQAREESHQRMLAAEEKRVKLKRELWRLNGATGPYNPFQ